MGGVRFSVSLKLPVLLLLVVLLLHSKLAHGAKFSIQPANTISLFPYAATASGATGTSSPLVPVVWVGT